jgi:short-subunit dehydrogenase
MRYWYYGTTRRNSDAKIKNNFETNFFGPIAVMQAVPQMRVQKSGLIINITSIAAYMGLPYRSILSKVRLNW